MASKPEPPESIVLQQFAGMRNNVAPERLAPTDLEAAVNVDLDDAGQPRRRRGTTQADDSAYHSLKTLPRGTLVVKDGALGWLAANLSFTQLLAGAGPDRLAYVQVGDEVFFSSSTVSGVIRSDNSIGAWGASADAGAWISPVVNPTATLGAISGKTLAAPPLATELEYYKGRIYLAQGPTLWATELFLYHYVEPTRTFFQFEGDTTLVMAVDDGLYVGTTRGLHFLKGELGKGMAMTRISDTPVLAGSGIVVPADRIHPQARQTPVPDSTVAAFMTGDGFYVGLDGGEVYNLTRERMVFPVAQSAAALYREQDGITSCVVVADNGGTPTSTARIGDYCDAEIIRAADRGV